MSLPAVAIILPLGLSPELAETVLRNCDLAIGAGACTLASSNDTSNRAAWLARVLQPADTPLAVQVELQASASAATAVTQRRSLAFEEGERPLQQWSAVGVVIAALAIAAEAEQTAGNKERSALNASKADASGNAPTPSHTQPVQRSAANPSGNARLRPNATPISTPGAREVRVDGGTLLTPGLDRRHPRYGFNLRPSVKLTRQWFVQGQFLASRADGNVTTRGYAGEIGLGLVLAAPSQPWALEAHVSAYAEALRFGASNDAGEHAAAWRKRFGAAAGLDVIVPFSQHWGWFVAIEGQLASPRVRVQVASREVASVAPLTVLGTTGLRFTIDVSP
jgi:hypothetical protein